MWASCSRDLCAYYMCLLCAYYVLTSTCRSRHCTMCLLCAYKYLPQQALYYVPTMCLQVAAAAGTALRRQDRRQEGAPRCEAEQPEPALAVLELPQPCRAPRGEPRRARQWQPQWRCRQQRRHRPGLRIYLQDLSPRVCVSTRLTRRAAGDASSGQSWHARGLVYADVGRPVLTSLIP